MSWDQNAETGLDACFGSVRLCRCSILDLRCVLEVLLQSHCIAPTGPTQSSPLCSNFTLTSASLVRSVFPSNSLSLTITDTVLFTEMDKDAHTGRLSLGAAHLTSILCSMADQQLSWTRLDSAQRSTLRRFATHSTLEHVRTGYIQPCVTIAYRVFV